MTYQEIMIDASQDAAKQFFDYAKAVPADKLEWSPLDAGRSVLSMCQEIAMTPTWALGAFTVDAKSWNEADQQEQGKLMATWTTIAACEKEFAERFAKLAEYWRGLSESDLAKTKWLPYDGGRDFTFREMMDYPRWNATYHLGQVGYIQVLYGDKEMH